MDKFFHLRLRGCGDAWIDGDYPKSLTVGADDSPLAAVSRQARGIHVPVGRGRASSRTSLWSLLVPVLVLLTVSGRWLYANAAPVMPALQSYWLPIHVSVVSLGSG